MIFMVRKQFISRSAWIALGSLSLPFPRAPCLTPGSHSWLSFLVAVFYPKLPFDHREIYLIEVLPNRVGTASESTIDK